MATLASLTVNLTAQTSRFTEPLRSAERTVQAFSGATERAARRVESFAQSVDKFAASSRRGALALTTVAGVSVSASVSFDRAMAQVRAVTGATADQFRSLRAEAERLGRETKFSAREVADGFTFMAMAGMSVENMLGAGERVTRLAAAANIDLARSADIVTNIMAGFRMEVDDLDRAVDTLTKAFTSANVDLDMLGESMKFVGPMAHNAGVAFEEITAAVGMLGNVGIQGSEAGTALARAISIMVAPTAKQAREMQRLGIRTHDAQGQFVGLTSVLEQLEQVGADVSDIMPLFEQRAGRAITALVGSSRELRQFTDILREAGGWADQVASVQLEGFQGQLVVFRSQIEGARIAIGRGLTPALSVLVGWLQSGLQLFLDMAPEQRQNIIRWAALTGAVLAAASTLGILSRVLVGAAAILRTFGQVLALAFSPIVMYTALAIGAIALFKTAWDRDWLGIQTRARTAVGYINEQLDRLLEWWKTSDIGQSVRAWWGEVVAIWESDELTLPEKIIETLNLVPGVNSLLRFVESVRGIWDDEELTFRQKLVEIARITPGVRWVVDFVENVQAIWVDEDLTLREKVAKIARLIPGALWLEGFIADVRSVWQSEELSLPAKIVEIARLIPGVSAIERMIEEIRTIWSNEDLTLGEKFVGTFKVISDTIALEAGGLAFLFGAAVTAPYILDALGTAIRTIPGMLALTEGGNLLRLTVTGMVLALGVASWKFFNASPEAREEILQSIERIIDDIFPDGFEGFAEDAKAILRFAVEPAGELFDAIKHGLNTGDWSQVFGAAADVWRSGVTLYVSLQLAAMAVQEVLSMMAIGFGFPAVRQLGPGAVLGTISVGIALVEAYETGHYRKFGEDLVAALAAGLIAGGLTRSPQAGMLAFTLVLNLQLGSTIGDWFRGDEVQREIEALQERADNLLWALDRQPRPFSSSVVGPLFDELDEINRRLDELGAAPVEIPFPRIQLAPVEAPVEPVEIPAVLSIEDVLGLSGLDAILDAIYVAEGGAAARVPYGATGFYDAGHRFALEKNQQLFDELVRSLNLGEGTEDYYRAAAAVTVKHYWDTFAREFPEVADRTFAQLVPEVQAAFIRHLGQFYAPVEAHALNVNWTPNVLSGLGLRGFASGGWTGNAPVDQITGFVHGQEIVIPEPAHRKGLAGILEFLGVPGFQTGYLPSGLMLTDGMGFAVAPTPEESTGWIRSEFERILGEIESLIGVDRANALRRTFEGLLNVTDRLEQELLRLWDALGQYEEEISDAIGSAQSLIESLDQLMEEQQRATEYQLALDSALAQVLGRLPILNQALQAIEAGAVYGPLGSVVGGMLALAVQSEAMSHGFRMVNETLQALADAVGMLLQPLLPLIHVLQAVLVPVFSVLGQVLASVLMPIMPFVFEAFRVVGIAVLFVAEMFQRARAFILDAVGGLVWGIGKFVDSLIGWITGLGRELMRAGDSLRKSADDARRSADELADSRRELIDLTYEEAMRRAQLTDEIERSIGGMINIPQGFRYALERMEAATARPAPAGVVPTPTPAVVPGSSDIDRSVGLSGGGVVQVHYHLHGDVYGWDDFKRRVQQAEAENRRDVGFALHGFAGGSG